MELPAVWTLPLIGGVKGHGRHLREVGLSLAFLKTLLVYVVDMLKDRPVSIASLVQGSTFDTT